jgi:hypothetical protein
MYAFRATLLTAGCLLSLAGVAYADSDWLKGSPAQQL